MRIVVVGIVVLVAAFLSFYVPARYENEIKFDQNGAGFLRQKAADLTITWQPAPKKVGLVKDRTTIEHIIDQMTPDCSRWTEHSSPTPGEWSLTFYSREHLRSVTIRFQGDFAICGRYARQLSPATVIEIRSQLTKASKIVDVSHM